MEVFGLQTFNVKHVRCNHSLYKQTRFDDMLPAKVWSVTRPKYFNTSITHVQGGHYINVAFRECI